MLRASAARVAGARGDTVQPGGWRVDHAAGIIWLAWRHRGAFRGRRHRAGSGVGVNISKLFTVALFSANRKDELCRRRVAAQRGGDNVTTRRGAASRRAWRK